MAAKYIPSLFEKQFLNIARLFMIILIISIHFVISFKLLFII